jgi:hypothetical protein
MSYSLYQEVEGKAGYWPDTNILLLHLSTVLNFGIRIYSPAATSGSSFEL